MFRIKKNHKSDTIKIYEVHEDVKMHKRQYDIISVEILSC